jgi:hypothetical protein
MESHPVHQCVASPLCVLQELELEDFVHTMCDALDEEEKRNPLHTDRQAFQLNDLFVRAHGRPQGEYTIFTSAMASDAAIPIGGGRGQARVGSS